MRSSASMHCSRKYDVARLPFSLKILLENLLAQRGRRVDPGAGHRGACHLEREGGAEQGDRVHAGARRDAGLHRRSRGRRPRRDARRDVRDGRRPGEDQPARAGRARDRPLGAGRRVRDTRTRSSATPSSSSSATRSATRSCAGARARSTTSPSSRPTRGSSTRSTSSTSPGSCSSTARARPRVPRHARRDRLAHDDDQRPRRARLGRRRDRGRGRDARPADVDADPAGPRLQADRRASGGRDRDRPRAHGHRDAARAGRRRQVRRVLRRRPGESAARRPGDDRQHVAGVRLDVRDLPDRPRDAVLPRVHRTPEGADRARRGVHEGAGALARRGLRGADVHRHARARPRRGRAEHRRAEAPAGPRLADRVEGRVPDGARGLPARGERRGRGERGELPGERSGLDAHAERRRPRADRRHRRSSGRRPASRPARR